MSHKNENLKMHHSYHTSPCGDISCSPSHWKSDLNIVSTHVNKDPVSSEKIQEYYKRYEHDVVPVKDDNSFNDHSFSEGNNSGTADNKDSITNSDLDKLELKILRKMSQELQTDADSASSLESNIKIFQTTVQQIFDKFNYTMQDFELYKEKYNDIIAKNKSTVEEMEDFIKEMIIHIGPTNSSVTNTLVRPSNKNITDCNNEPDKINIGPALQSYANENYFSDSTADENSSKSNANMKEETFNIYHLSNNPRGEVKMTNRSLLSEINIRDQPKDIKGQLASAENIKKLAAKRLEIEQYVNGTENHDRDKEIPVKNTAPKKNIYLDEDFTHFKNENSKFFIFKICSYLCRKLRKNY